MLALDYEPVKEKKTSNEKHVILREQTRSMRKMTTSQRSGGAPGVEGAADAEKDRNKCRKSKMIKVDRVLLSIKL